MWLFAALKFFFCLAFLGWSFGIISLPAPGNPGQEYLVLGQIIRYGSEEEEKRKKVSCIEKALAIISKTGNFQPKTCSLVI